MLASAARRFLILLGAAAGVTVAGSLLLGLAAGSSVRRALTVGFYLMGSFLLLAGFFVGTRGRTRVETDSTRGGLLPYLASRRLRMASEEEEREVIGTSAIVITLGLFLIVVGAAVDPENDLY